MRWSLAVALWLSIGASVAHASGTGVALTSGFRLPLMDGADPLPWSGKGAAPVAGMRLDALGGFTAHTASGWETGVHGRLSGYALVWSESVVAPGHRGALEWGVRRFVPPNDERLETGMWAGGYAGGTVMAEIWGRYPTDPFQVGTASVVLGYRWLAQDIQPAFLELGAGAWGDRFASVGGAGFVARAGLEFFRPVWGEGTR